jgi:diguanylate cyclase (GGDEF)-like protein
MALDTVTILVVQVLIILLVSVSYLVTWLETREEETLLWMAGAAFCAALGLILRFCLPPPTALILSNGLVEGAACGLWLACRRLRRAPAWPIILPVPLLLWGFLLALPAVFDDIGRRVILANTVLALIFLLATREVWKLERENGPLRLYILALLGFQATLHLAWAALNLLLPPPADGEFLTLPGIVVIDLVSLFVTLLMAIGLIVLVRERAVRTYRDAATLDAVTGIANRRAFDERLTVMLADVERRGTSLALVMMDADHFKSYNDRYGHLQGDHCLRRLAQCVQAVAAGSGGHVFRYGGEEFVALLPGLDRAGVMAFAEQLRRDVHNLRIAHEAEAGGIMTISMGAALTEWGGASGASAEAAAALIHAADQALYQAKGSGRDRIFIVAGGQVLASQPSGAWATLPG